MGSKLVRLKINWNEKREGRMAGGQMENKAQRWDEIRWAGGVERCKMSQNKEKTLEQRDSIRLQHCDNTRRAGAAIGTELLAVFALFWHLWNNHQSWRWNTTVWLSPQATWGLSDTRQLNYLQMKLKTFKISVHLLLGGGGTSLTLWGAERKRQNLQRKREPAASELSYALAFLRGAK